MAEGGSARLDILEEDLPELERRRGIGGIFIL